MPRLDDSFAAMTGALSDRFGLAVTSASVDSSGPFTTLVAAAIRSTGDQRTTERVLAALRDAGLLDAAALDQTSLTELSTVFPAALGAVPPKLLNLLVKLAKWVESRGGENGWTHVATSELREELLGLKGVGLATADELLLFGLDRAVFPVGRAAYRILARHGWIDETADYDEARELMGGVVGDEPSNLRRFSTWFEMVGREYCRAAAAKCERCPLRPFLPEGGPLGDDS
jgi:endonuclease-3 related protein